MKKILSKIGKGIMQISVAAIMLIGLVYLRIYEIKPSYIPKGNIH